MGKHRDDSVRARQAAQTRSRIVAAATALFTEHGYAATSLDEIAGAADVTKGALYHHFTDKPALFRAAYAAVLDDVAEAAAQVAAATIGGDRVAVFVDGCIQFVARAASDARMVRLLITEGRAALGERAWRELDDAFTRAVIGSRLQSLQERGLLRRGVDMQVAGQLLNAMINEAALRVALAADPTEELAASAPVLRAFVDGLRAA